MPLTTKQRASLAKQGFTKADIADIDKVTAPDEDEANGKPPARRGRRERHVAILSGADADEFLTRVFGDNGEADDTDADADRDDADADADASADAPDADASDEPADEPEPDEKPTPRKGYFS